MAKKPTNVNDFFNGDINLADFSKGMARMPELGTMLRLAGLGDAAKMASVKMTSSRIDAVRANAVGSKRAKERAKRARDHSTKLTTSLVREEETAKPEVGLFDQIGRLTGQFQLYGKVIDAEGRPVPNATIEVSGKDSKAMFSTKTDDKGVYRIGLPVSDKETDVTDGEDLLEKVISLDGTVLQQGLLGVVSAGEMARKVLSVPLSQTLTDLAAPILRGRTVKTKTDDTKVEEIKRKTDTAKKKTTGTKTKTQAKTKKPPK